MRTLLYCMFASLAIQSAHGTHRDNYDWAENPDTPNNTMHVPFLLAPTAQEPGGGILRIINHSDKNGYARITGLTMRGGAMGRAIGI